MAKEKMEWYDTAGLIALAVGGVTWGLVAFGINPIAAILGTGLLTKIVYVVIGAAGVMSIISMFK
jgi:uncharacterized membrane protein YuzA (DUF378 family)